MDERNIKVTAVIGAIIAVIAVGFLLVTTYTGDDEDAVAVTEPTPAEGPPVPGNPDPASEDPSEAPGAGAGHDDESPADPTADPETSAVLIEVTTDFFAAWLRPGELEERQKAVEPYATPAFVDLMALTDPNPLPKGPIRGEPEVSGLQSYVASTYVELAGGVNYRVNLVLEPDGWRVNELLADEDSPAFAEQSPPQSAPDTAAPDTAAPDTEAPDTESEEGTEPAAEPTDVPTSDGAGEG